LSPAALAKLKLPELRERCLSAGLSPDGKKADLVARLTAAAEGGGGVGDEQGSGEGGYAGGGGEADAAGRAAIDAADPMAALLRELDSMEAEQLAGELTARGVPLPASGVKSALVMALAELLMREATEALAATEAAATTEAAAEQADARADELASLGGRPGTLLQTIRDGLKEVAYQELVFELQARGLPTAGRKEELVERLAAAMAAAVERCAPCERRPPRTRTRRAAACVGGLDGARLHCRAHQLLTRSVSRRGLSSSHHTQRRGARL